MVVYYLKFNYLSYTFLSTLGEFSSDMMRDIREEQNVRVDQEDLNTYNSLNKEQRAGFDEIMHHVIDRKSQVFFIDGPRGTGKTFLYKALLAKVRSEGLIAIATATSGIAASLLPGGRTAHSSKVFKAVGRGEATGNRSVA